MNKKSLIIALLLITLTPTVLAADGWQSLFNGKDLTGWKPNFYPDSWSVVNGTIRAHATKSSSHLFFVGDKPDGEFVRFTNLVLELSARSEPHANSGIYFHTDYEAPNAQHHLANGYEVQLNSTEKEKRKTGSLYAVVDLPKSPVDESQWFHVRISVQGKRIVVQLNDKTVVDYTEPPNVQRSGERAGQNSIPPEGPSRSRATIPIAFFISRTSGSNGFRNTPHRQMNTRREFLTKSVVAVAGATLVPTLFAANSEKPAARQIRVGTCVVGLAQAKQAGLDGAEVRVGEAADTLEIADPKVRARYKEQMQQTGLPVCSLMMGLLNQYPLATDRRAPAWLEQSIDAARDLGARVILVAFFGNGDLLGADGKVKEADVDVLVQRLKAVAPRAKDAGVILGIENYLNGAQNVRILDRINHDSVQLYFDVYNTGTTKGHNVPADIRLLKGRIAQFHFKNGEHYLDYNKGKFEPIAAAIKEVEFRGWVVLETSNPSKNPVADAKRNGDYTRAMFS